MKIDLDALSRAELVALNHEIVDRIKLLDTMATQQSMLRFRPHTRVSFTMTDGTRTMGMVVKQNHKTVSVVTDNGERWNIAPQLLSPIKDVSPGEIIQGNREPD